MNLEDPSSWTYIKGEVNGCIVANQKWVTFKILKSDSHHVWDNGNTFIGRRMDGPQLLYQEGISDKAFQQSAQKDKAIKHSTQGTK